MIGKYIVQRTLTSEASYDHSRKSLRLLPPPNHRRINRANESNTSNHLENQMSSVEFANHPDARYVLVFRFQGKDGQLHDSHIPCENGRQVRDEITRCLMSPLYINCSVVKRMEEELMPPPPTVRELDRVFFDEDDVWRGCLATD